MKWKQRLRFDPKLKCFGQRPPDNTEKIGEATKDKGSFCYEVRFSSKIQYIKLFLDVFLDIGTTHLSDQDLPHKLLYFNLNNTTKT